jgi:hypothetical protein
MHEITCIMVRNVSRSVPLQPFTNLWIAQGKQQICRGNDYGVKCTEWTFENCWLGPKLAQFFANVKFS